MIPNLKTIIKRKKYHYLCSGWQTDFHNSQEDSNIASKFGLRGLVFSLRQILSQHRISVTLINPSNLSTDEVLNDLKNSGKDETHSIPLSDFSK